MIKDQKESLVLLPNFITKIFKQIKNLKEECKKYTYSNHKPQQPLSFAVFASYLLLEQNHCKLSCRRPGPSPFNVSTCNSYK